MVVRDYLACRSPAHPGTLFQRPDPDFKSPEERREWIKAFWMWLCPETVDEKEAQSLYERGFETGCRHADGLGDQWLSVPRMSYLQEAGAWEVFFWVHKPDQERVRFPWIKLQPRMTARSTPSAAYRQWRVANDKPVTDDGRVEAEIVSAREEIVPRSRSV